MVYHTRLISVPHAFAMQISIFPVPKLHVPLEARAFIGSMGTNTNCSTNFGSTFEELQRLQGQKVRMQEEILGAMENV